MCGAVSDLGLDVRETPKLSLGTRPGPPELAGHQCVCLLSQWTYMFSCCPMSGIQRGRGGALPTLQLSAQC